MMKIICVFAALALASCEKPVITLNLEEASTLSVQDLCTAEEMWNVLVENTDSCTDAQSSCNPSDRAGHVGSTKIGVANHCSGQIYTKRCEVTYCDTTDSACASTAQTDCPEPEAQAYDHHEGQLAAVDKAYVLYVESDPGTFPPNKVDRLIDPSDYILGSGVDHNQRGEYLIEYSAVDSSQNAADNVHFAMIVVDTAAPWADAIVNLNVSPNIPDGTNYGYTYTLPTAPAAADEYDENVSPTLTVVSASNAGSSSIVSIGSGSATITNIAEGEYTFTYAWNDYASIFGHNNHNNILELTGKITVTDAKSPVMFCGGTSATDTCTAGTSSITCDNSVESSTTCPAQYL